MPASPLVGIAVGTAAVLALRWRDVVDYVLDRVGPPPSPSIDARRRERAW